MTARTRASRLAGPHRSAALSRLPMSTSPAATIEFARRISAAEFDLSLVVPAYNEAIRLPKTLDGLADWSASQPFSVEILVVDDGSCDTTAATAANHHCGCGVIRLARNEGKGAAVRTGMLEARGRVVGFTDADLPYRLDAVRRAYATIVSGAADVVYGGRDLEASTMAVQRTATRQLASRCFRAIAGRLVGGGVTDTQCGLKVFGREAAQQIFGRVHTNGFAFDAEAILVAQRLGLRAARVPVVLVNEAGSTVSLRRHAPKMLRDVLQARLRHGRRAGPMTAAVSEHVVLRAAIQVRRRAA